MGLSTPLVGLAGALLVGGLALVVMGLIPVHTASTPLSTRLWTTVDKRVAGMPRRRRIHLLAGLLAALLAYLVTGWPVLLVVVPALAVGVPALLADPPGDDLELLRGLERWVRLVNGSASTGKSIIDAIRATRSQAPEVLEEPLARLVARLDSRWDVRAALQGFAEDLGSADADQVVAAVMIAAGRGGTGATTTLAALAQALQDRIRAQREITTERSRPRIVVRQVSLVMAGVLAAALVLGRDFMAPYRTLTGQVLLCVYAGIHVGGLVVLSRRSRPRRRSRILVIGDTARTRFGPSGVPDA